MADEPRWSRLEQFCAANNIPIPPPMTDAEVAEFERRQDEVDAAIERRYGLGHVDAA
jgi:hypothetical protein